MQTSYEIVYCMKPRWKGRSSSEYFLNYYWQLLV